MVEYMGSLTEDMGVVRTDDGHSVAWQSAGSGERTVVLIHGLTLDSRIWERQVRDLTAAGHRVVTVDQRGHGASSPISATVAPQRLGTDIACVLEDLDLRDAVICGHSLGGIATLAFVTAHPGIAAERLSGMVLLSTTATARFVSHVAPMHALVAPIERIAYKGAPGWLPTPVQVALRPGVIGRRVMRLAFGTGADSADVADAASLFTTTARRTMRHLFEGLLDWHLLDSLGEVQTPALIVCGNRDIVTPIALSRHMHRRLAGSELYEIPGGGHMLMMERPRLVSDLIEDFVGRTTSPDGAARAARAAGAAGEVAASAG